MFRRHWLNVGLSLFVLSLAAIAWADRLTLKDGTVLEGKVIKQADQYWVKTADGESRIVPATDVASYQKSAPPSVAPPTPAPENPAPTPTPTPTKPVAPPAPVAPPPPAKTNVTVPATASSTHPIATGVKLTEGQQFILTPNATDTWSKSSGNHKDKKCDYKGYTDRAGWMALTCKVGNSGITFTAGAPAEAPEAGELMLFCADTDSAGNVGSIRVTIVGPLAPTFASVMHRVDAAETAPVIVGILTDFLAARPAEPDLSKGKAELAKWSDIVAKGGGEKIEGKWVTGEEHKALIEQAKSLIKEGMEKLQRNETLQGIKKLEAAQAIYPNSWLVNFLLGFVALNTNDLDKALPLFERAQKIRPKSAETLANIGYIHFKQRDYERGILELHQAAELADTGEIAWDLNAAILMAPANVRGSDKIKEALSDAKLLASKYNLPLELLKQVGIRPIPPGEAGGGGGHGGEEGPPPPGAQATGTGFVINSDGLILTNRHVAKGGKSYELTLHDGTKLKAEAVAIDDEQDLALLRCKPIKPLPIVYFSDHDAPGDGAECTVIGFPLGDRYTAAAKVTHGIVTTGHANTDGADVMIDAKVNPGNSGGPILDQSGHLMAIVCMKTLSTQTEDTYGLGISTGKIRKFLDKNHVKVEKAVRGKNLSTEEIAAKVEPMTVFILTTF